MVYIALAVSFWIFFWSFWSIIGIIFCRALHVSEQPKFRNQSFARSWETSLLQCLANHFLSQQATQKQKAEPYVFQESIFVWVNEWYSIYNREQHKKHIGVWVGHCSTSASGVPICTGCVPNDKEHCKLFERDIGCVQGRAQFGRIVMKNKN